MAAARRADHGEGADHTPRFCARQERERSAQLRSGLSPSPHTSCTSSEYAATWRSRVRRMGSTMACAMSRRSNGSRCSSGNRARALAWKGLTRQFSPIEFRSEPGGPPANEEGSASRRASSSCLVSECPFALRANTDARSLRLRRTHHLNVARLRQSHGFDPRVIHADGLTGCKLKLPGLIGLDSVAEGLGLA